MVTGAPTALAFALGFHAAINGVAANGTPDKPTALVRPIKTFLRVLFFSCINNKRFIYIWYYETWLLYQNIYIKNSKFLTF